MKKAPEIPTSFLLTTRCNPTSHTKYETIVAEYKYNEWDCITMYMVVRKSRVLIILIWCKKKILPNFSKQIKQLISNNI